MLIRILVSILFGVACALIVDVIGHLFAKAGVLLPLSGVIGLIAGILYFIYGTYPARA